MAKKQKAKAVAATAITRQDKKAVRAASQQTDTAIKPAWRFSTVDKQGPFPWPIGTEKEIAIVSKLHQFDSMTWSEIAGKEHHAIAISALSERTQKRLADIKQDDIDQVFSFRLQGKPRIIGIRTCSESFAFEQ